MEGMSPSRRASVGAMGIVIANIGFVIPWNVVSQADNKSAWFGIDQQNVAVTVWAIFMLLAVGIVLGALFNVGLLQWCAQLTAGMWCSVGSLYVLAGDPGLGVLCLGISIMSLSVDWTCGKRFDVGYRPSATG